MFADVGLELFKNVHRLKEMNLFNGCLSGKFPEPMPAIPSDLVVECLTVCTDQEQTQVTGGEFIFTPEPFGLGCTGARLHDDFHRWNNDVSMAVALAGLKPSEKAGTLIANIGYGPWQTAAWFNTLCAHGSKGGTHATARRDHAVIARASLSEDQDRGTDTTLADSHRTPCRASPCSSSRCPRPSTP